MLFLVKYILLFSIDAGVLVFVLQAISNDELDFQTAVLVSVGAAIGTTALVLGLASALGIMGMVLALVLAVALLGVAISAMLGVEIKRAVLAGVIFLVTHIGTSYMLNAVF